MKRYVIGKGRKALGHKGWGTLKNAFLWNYEDGYDNLKSGEELVEVDVKIKRKRLSKR